MEAATSGAILIVTDTELRIRTAGDPAKYCKSSNGDSGPYKNMVGANLLDHVPERDRAHIQNICKSILDGRVFSGTKSYRKIVSKEETGNGRWIIVLGPAVGKGGHIDGIVYSRFITDQPIDDIRHEVESSKFYEGLVESAGDVIILVDRNGIIQFINRRAENYGAQGPSCILGKHFSEFVHPDDINKCRELLVRAFESRGPFSGLNVRALLSNGARRYIVANGNIVNTGNGVRLLAICRDVTESIEMQQSLLARNRALSSLNGIMAALSRYASQDDALELALEKILSALDLEIGAILIRTGDGRMRIGAYSLSSSDGKAKEVAVNLSQLCGSLGEPVIVRDVKGDERIDAHTREALLDLGVEAGIVVPLRCGGPVTAVLALAMPAPADLSLEQMEFINLAAGILGPAIENARLHMDLADRVHRLAMLERLAKSINAGRDVHAVLNACLHEIGDLIAYDTAVVTLVENNGEAEVFRFTRDGYSEPLERTHLTMEQLDRLAAMQGPVVAPDLNQIAPLHTWGFLAFDHGSAVCARLTYKSKGFGLLNIWSKAADQFGQREMEILEAAAEHLAIAISNARLYEAERVKSLQLEALAKEAQHRIKNNLQMITGLLSISEADSDGNNKAMSRCLRQIRSIATIHELLNPDNITGMLRLKEVLRRIASSAVFAMGRSEIQIAVNGSERMLSADAATAVGIIVNELVSNAVEHALVGREDGCIEITIGTVGKHTIVEVIDNGSGMPEGFTIPKSPDSVSGLALVTSLAMYGLGGKLDIDSDRNGTRVTIEF